MIKFLKGVPGSVIEGYIIANGRARKITVGTDIKLISRNDTNNDLLFVLVTPDTSDSDAVVEFYGNGSGNYGVPIDKFPMVFVLKPHKALYATCMTGAGTVTLYVYELNEGGN